MQKNISIKDFIYFTIIFLLTTGIYFLHVKNSNLDFLLNQNTNQIEELQTQINMLKEEIIKKSQVEASITKTISVESQIEPVSRGYSWVLFAFIGLVLTYKVFSLINLYYIPGLFWNTAGSILNDTSIAGTRFDFVYGFVKERPLEFISYGLDFFFKNLKLSTGTVKASEGVAAVVKEGLLNNF